MRRIVSAVVAMGLATSPLLLAAPAFAGPAPATGSICGYSWNDLNSDGIRQPGEPPMQTSMGISGTDNYDTATDQNGHYCITGLPFGSYRVQFNDLILTNAYGWTEPGHDSRPDWTDGTSGLVDVGVHGAPAEIDNFDVGYAKGADNVKAGHLSVDAPRTPQVGDLVVITSVTGVTGNVADVMDAELDLPGGLTVQKVYGDMTADLTDQPHKVQGQPWARAVPGSQHTLDVLARVTAPMHDATITLTDHQYGYPDTNPDDNVLTTTISAIAAPPSTTTAPPTTTTAPPHTTTSQPAAGVPATPGNTGTGTGVRTTASEGSLPFTGVSVIEPLVGAITLVLVGVAGFWLTRRRRQAR